MENEKRVLICCGAGEAYVQSPQFDVYKEGYRFKEAALGKGYYKDRLDLVDLVDLV